MFFKTLFVVVLLVSSVSHFASSQTSCGTADTCSSDYSEGCPEDVSADLTCMQSQTSCNEPLVSPANTAVQCYSTCIVGAPFDPTIPLQCCANSILDQPLTNTTDPNYVITRMYSPNSPDQEVYRSNTVCNYNIQCPNNFDLHYVLVRYDIEPPSNSGDCLDFLRFHFTATGANVDRDVCGDATSDPIPDIVQSGFHGSSLSLEFRSNRITTDNGFFLAAVCINPAPFRVARQVEAGFQQRSDCQPSQLLPGYRIIGKKKRSLEHFDIEDAFHIRGKRSFRTPWVRVTTARVVKYENNILYVEERGVVVYRYERMQVLQVYNKIEGYLTFYGSSSPPGRTFPGYGKLHIGRGLAYYIQTIVDPRFLLSEEEDVIVSELLGELFRRQAFSSEQFYFTPPPTFASPEINCTVNALAELNNRSCTAVVRSTADFFLRTDPFKVYCRHSG